MKHRFAKIPDGCYPYMEVSKESDPEILMDDGTWIFAKDEPGSNLGNYYLPGRQAILVPTWPYEFYSLEEYQEHLDKWETGKFHYLVTYRDWESANKGVLWPTFGVARDIKPFFVQPMCCDLQEWPVTGGRMLRIFCQKLGIIKQGQLGL